MCDEAIRSLLSEGLDLCIRARDMDARDRRQAALGAATDPEAWQASGRFGAFVARNNIEHPEAPIHTRSGTVPMWLEAQFQSDLSDWEKRARKALLSPPPAGDGWRPRVKPLAFVDGPHPMTFSAGEYFIEDRGTNWTDNNRFELSQGGLSIQNRISRHGTMDEAVTAANEHNCARILSALDLPAPPFSGGGHDNA